MKKQKQEPGIIKIVMPIGMRSYSYLVKVMSYLSPDLYGLDNIGDYKPEPFLYGLDATYGHKPEAFLYWLDTAYDDKPEPFLYGLDSIGDNKPEPFLETIYDS